MERRTHRMVRSHLGGTGKAGPPARLSSLEGQGSGKGSQPPSPHLPCPGKCPSLTPPTPTVTCASLQHVSMTPCSSSHHGPLSVAIAEHSRRDTLEDNGFCQLPVLELGSSQVEGLHQLQAFLYRRALCHILWWPRALHGERATAGDRGKSVFMAAPLLR